MEGNRSLGQGAVRSGLYTGISTAAVSGSAAVLGVILSRKFGHGVKTDGFFAAYGPYLALTLVASSLRVVVFGNFVDARKSGRLGQEVGTWGVALAPPLALALVVALVWPHGLADALTSNARASDYAASLLPWLAVAAVAQVYCGLTASALAVLDDYVSAAFGFAFGSVLGVAVTLALLSHGVIALGWGLAVNALVSLMIPLVPLLRRRGVRWPDRRSWTPLIELGEGVALPVALQGLYLVGYRFASGLGPGKATTFSYAYLIAAFLVAVTAGSIALVATVPFARGGSSPERIAKHVVAISWLSLVVVAAAAGLFALAGAPAIHRVLGAGYGGATGAQLGQLVVYLAPWMVGTVAATIAYPLVFVGGRARWLPVLAGTAFGAHVLIEWAARAWFGLPGVAAGLALTTALVLVVLLGTLRALRTVALGLARATFACGVLAAVTFGLAQLLFDPIPAAVVGLVAYSLALATWRPTGLRSAWAYLHALQ
jgi:hypothetical protein